MDHEMSQIIEIEENESSELAQIWFVLQNYFFLTRS